MKVMLEFDSQFPLFHNPNTVEPPCATTFHKTTSHKQSPVQNTKIFPVEALPLEPLVKDHLL